MTVGALILRPASEARAYWPAIRRELAAIAERWPDDWMPEDVWHEIMTDNAYLWAAGEPGALDAWVVLQVMTRSYDGRILHVWQAGESTDARAADYWPQIMQIAADADCRRVTIETPRRWERVLPGARLRYAYTFDVGGQDVDG